MSRRSFFLLAELGLSVLFLVLVLIGSMDFSHRLQQEEQQIHLRSQTEQEQAKQQTLLDQNQRLNDALQKQEQQSQTLVQDNLALLDQNSTLMVQLAPDPQGATAGKRVLPSGPGEVPAGSAAEQLLLNNQQALQRLQQAPSAPPPEKSVPAKDDSYWQKMVESHQDAPVMPPIPPEMVVLDSPTSAVPDSGNAGNNGEGFWEEMVSFFQGGSPGEKGTGKGRAVTESAPSPVVAAQVTHSVIAESSQESKARLLRQLQVDLQRQQIAADIYPRSDVLALPGLLDFAAEGSAPDPAVMQRLALVLNQRLACFCAGVRPVHCPVVTESAPMLEGIVVTAYSGAAVLGSGAFRYHWNQASGRAAQFYVELLAADGSFGQWRNRQGESLFRLDGFLPMDPPAVDASQKLQKQVALRLIWQ
ncbi:MAG: hypothetical protein HQM04_01820 [Magnetococcales bacterium]|nr:hypothetical protein [Magnetococcales bacterium]MBF0113757.1 hypothetical protein [Magnetococcales bacterium]